MTPVTVWDLRDMVDDLDQARICVASRRVLAAFAREALARMGAKQVLDEANRRQKCRRPQGAK